MSSNSGKVFDNTVDYSYKKEEVEEFLSYYFTDNEIKNKAVLDAGCRTGYFSCGFIERGAKEVIGIDLSKECIEFARNKYGHIKNIKFIQGDISNLKQFHDSLFDIVFCVGTICYLKPEQIQVALKEFLRVTKPDGIILVLFQKEKGTAARLVRFLANIIPLRLYLFLINNFAYLIKPFLKPMLGRKISLDHLKYDVLLSLRGVFFGIPVEIPDKYRVVTASTIHSSEKTSTSFKISVPREKEELDFKLIKL